MEYIFEILEILLFVEGNSVIKLGLNIKYKNMVGGLQMGHVSNHLGHFFVISSLFYLIKL